MTSICADTFGFQGIMQTVQKAECTPYPIMTWFFGVLLYRHFYFMRRDIRQIAINFRQAKYDDYAEYNDKIPTILSNSKTINNKLSALHFPMFVQRIALEIEHELSDLLEDIYIASDPEIKELSQELETLLS